MTHNPFQKMTPEQAVEAVVNTSPKDLENRADQMSKEQIISVLECLDMKNDVLWKEKTTALFRGLKNHTLIESMARASSLQQALEIVSDCFYNPLKNSLKLSPFFIGLNPTVFARLIFQADLNQLHKLQQEAITEPIQNQIIHLIHEMENEEIQISHNLDNLAQQILLQDIAKLTKQELCHLEEELEQLQETIESALLKLEKVLSLAWNTDRPDLIEKLSHLKEKYNHDLKIGLGNPQRVDQPPSGLHAYLLEALSSVFGKGVTALHDDDSTLEAMARLGAWYITDYWDLGLLPGIERKQLLTLNEGNKEKTLKEKIRRHAIENMEIVGLSTVKDFKEAKIFSKAMLADFINDRKNSLLQLSLY